LIPLIEKTAWRYMQFDPDNYPVQDFKFVASSSLGVIAREYEVTQLVQLMQTMGQDSPVYPLLIAAVIDNMGVANREELLEQIKAASQPNPEAQQSAMQQQQMQMELMSAQLQLTQAQAQKAVADANKAQVDAQLAPQMAQAKYISALSNNLDEDDESKDFERRVKIAELSLKEKDIDTNVEITRMQMSNQNNMN
jgi:uncharacterized membrane protein